MFDAECQQVLDRANAAADPDEPLGMEHVLAALFHHAPIRGRYPLHGVLFPEPPENGIPFTPQRDLTAALRAVLSWLSAWKSPLTVWQVLAGLLARPEGRRELLEQGFLNTRIADLQRSLHDVPLPPLPRGAGGKEGQAPAPGPIGREGETDEDILRRQRELEVAARRERLERLGRILNSIQIEPTDLFEREALIPSLSRGLVRLVRNNVLIVGPEGVGRTTLAMELFRRIADSDPSIPLALHGRTVLQVSYLGERVSGRDPLEELAEALRRYPDVILYFERIGDLLIRREGSGITPTAARLVEEIVRGPTAVVGCLLPAEVAAIQRSPPWNGQFEWVGVESARPDSVARILHARLPEFRRHYAGLTIPDGIPDEVVQAAAEALTEGIEPSRSLDLLDDVCARCVAATPPRTTVDRDALDAALVARGARRARTPLALTDADLLAHLRGRIVGQDHVLPEIARAFVSGLAGWAVKGRPRGVFLFGGPTGVGKTETAVALSQALDPSGRSLIRVNCNILQGGGREKESVLWPLLGVPPGFVGHGRGGLLSPIRSRPGSVVLFDEFEKADPAVGKMLLQILDTGLQEDNDGNVLDFRQAFLVFTTNLGVDYEVGESFGFDASPSGTQPPRVSREAIFDQLLEMGYGHELLGRIRSVFLFQGLGPQAIRLLVRRLLDDLARDLKEHEIALTHEPALVDVIAARWRPRLGVRHLQGLLTHPARERLGAEAAAGRLASLRRVHLTHTPPLVPDEPGVLTIVLETIPGPGR